MKNEKTKYVDIRKPWFRRLKAVMRIAIKKSNFIYLDKKIDTPTIILSNHVGTSAPLAWELYGELALRFWGAFEMNSTLGELYKLPKRLAVIDRALHKNIHKCPVVIRAARLVVCNKRTPICNYHAGYAVTDIIFTAPTKLFNFKHL